MRKVMMRYLLPLLLLLVGCREDPSVILHEPKPQDVEGVWESLSLYQYFPFGVVKIEKNGKGKVVLVSEEKATFIAYLSEFKTQEKSFLITLTGTEEGDEPELWEGSVRRGQLCFRMLEEEVSSSKMSEGEFMFACFTKSSEIKDYRQAAYSELQ
ncbi:hypothetical protein [Marinibactrum halimedae]|nr:hypothetical protein [Marinibactrum halimedae]MCD9461395.1 hypothetical protein [Marinibactrum halimedae]